MSGGVTIAALVLAWASIALRTWHSSDRAMRAALVVYLIQRKGEWVRGRELVEIFGLGVLRIARELNDQVLVDRREGPSTMQQLVARGGRPVVYYRWRDGAGTPPGGPCPSP